jgi:MFS family permease
MADVLSPKAKLAEAIEPPAAVSGSWFSTLTSQERRTFWACFSAWTLDAMDVQLYAVAMPTLIALWSLTKGQAGFLATSALMVSSLGGWLAGILADRFGRARIMKLTIIWFAAFTCLSGLTHSYGQLLAARTLQGLGFGGEWAAVGVLISETIAKEKRGRAAGTVASGWSVGYGSAVLLYYLLFSLVRPELAWRLLFILALIPAALVLWICRNVQEPAVYRKMQDARTKGIANSSLLEIFRPPLVWTTLVSSLLAAGALGGNYTILTWLPTYLKLVRNLSVLNTSGYLAVNIFGSFCGYVLSAHLSDWLGRRRTFAIMASCAAVTVAVYTLMPLSSLAVLLLGFPLGFFQSGIISGMSATFAELFPTRVRGTGQGFSYNTGRAVGSIVPATVGYLGAVHLGRAIGVCAVLSYVVVLIATAMLPETRARELEANA